MTETTKTETTKKNEETPKDEGENYFFPSGVTIKATSLEEAQKLYNKNLKDNKESDNG